MQRHILICLVKKQQDGNNTFQETCCPNKGEKGVRRIRETVSQRRVNPPACHQAKEQLKPWGDLTGSLFFESKSLIKTGKIVPNDRLGVSKFHNVRETSLDDGWAVGTTCQPMVN